jgi:hypothetical protein
LPLIRLLDTFTLLTLKFTRTWQFLHPSLHFSSSLLSLFSKYFSGQQVFICSMTGSRAFRPIFDSNCRPQPRHPRHGARAKRSSIQDGAPMEEVEVKRNTSG